MGFAPFIPEAGAEGSAIVLFAVAGVAFLTSLILLMLRFGIGVVTDALITALATFLPTWFGIRHDVTSGVAYVATKIDEALGKAAYASQGAAVATFNDAWKLTRWTGREIAALAAETAHAVTVLVTSTIPQAVEHPLRFIRDQVAGLVNTVTHLQRTVARDVAASLHTISTDLAKFKRQARAEIATAEHAITVTLPGTIGREIGDVRGWTSKQLRRLSRRLSAVEAAVGLTALAGVIVHVIAREVPWVRCPNMGRLGKQACNTPVREMERYLEGFALATAGVYTILDLEEIAKLMQAAIVDTSTVARVMLGVDPVHDLTSLHL